MVALSFCHFAVEFFISAKTVCRPISQPNISQIMTTGPNSAVFHQESGISYDSSVVCCEWPITNSMHTVLTSVVWLVAVLQPLLPLLFGSFANDFGKLANIKKPSLAAKLHSDINSNSGVS